MNLNENNATFFNSLYILDCPLLLQWPKCLFLYFYIDCKSIKRLAIGAQIKK